MIGVRFGMTGSLLVDGVDPVGRLLYSSTRFDPAWDRWSVDVRRRRGPRRPRPTAAGRRVTLDPDVSHLGEDAASVSLSGLRRALDGWSAPLKARLLDQSRVAGIGNLIADEVLWRAGLSPAPHIVVDAGGTPPAPPPPRAHLADLTERGGSHLGDLMDERHVGGVCPKDGTPLVRSTIGGRTTWWCRASGWQITAARMHVVRPSRRIVRPEIARPDGGHRRFDTATRCTPSSVATSPRPRRWVRNRCLPSTDGLHICGVVTRHRRMDLLADLGVLVQEHGEVASTHDVDDDVGLGDHGGGAWTVLQQRQLPEEVSAVACRHDLIVDQHVHRSSSTMMNSRPRTPWWVSFAPDRQIQAGGQTRYFLEFSLGESREQRTWEADRQWSSSPFGVLSRRRSPVAATLGDHAPGRPKIW